MRRASPADAGWTPGRSLGTLGRATRYACERAGDRADGAGDRADGAGADGAGDRADGAGAASAVGVELWRLGVGAEVIAERLLALGKRGVGGVIDGGIDGGIDGVIEGGAGVDVDVAADDADGEPGVGTGAWIIRIADAPTLAERVRASDTPTPWREAVAILRDLAAASAACERASLFPGPLNPAGVTLRPAAGFTTGEDGDGDRAGGDGGDGARVRAEIRAEPLVSALVGAPVAHGSPSSVSSRWIAPEQAAGADWDNRANRYVLGLIGYRLLAGEHAFAAKGLRLGLDEQAQRGAPPLPDDVRRALPPGLQSYILRMLDPDPARRPERAVDVAARMDEWLAGGVSSVRRSDTHDAREHASVRDSNRYDARGHGRVRQADSPVGAAAPSPPDAAAARSPLARALAKQAAERASASESSSSSSSAAASSSSSARRTARSARRHRGWSLWVAPALAVVAAVWIWARLGGVAPGAQAAAGVRAPIARADTTVDDCASCHARQASEWHRSIMAHSAKSPLFLALEMLIQEQVGRDFSCPGGAGALRKPDPRGACRDRRTGLEITGSGGAHWCVNCHSPGENLVESMPAWDGVSAVSASRRPLSELLPEPAMNGISCAFCHQVSGPVRPGNLARGVYEGNPFWTSTTTGQRFPMRPEDLRGVFGIANSGYSPDPAALLAGPQTPADELVPGGAHRRPTTDTKAYLRSSEFCGACHDVRLFGTDVIGARRGEHFKRLRNAYSEWVDWGARERRLGREPASCQDCHMSEFPGVCVSGTRTPTPGRRSRADDACPPGTRFEPRDPGRYPRGFAAAGSAAAPLTSHYFSGVDMPLATAFDPRLIDDTTTDASGIPLGGRQRRDLLLARTFRLDVPGPRRIGDALEIPIEIENIGAGHRVPAGFSQEREIWVHLRVTDASGRLVYEVGRVDRPDENLRDKIFQQVRTSDRFLDGAGRPLGLFGADVVDGPDVPQWFPPPERGGTRFRGRGLINFQNGFLRCVRCIGEVTPDGDCRPRPGQERHRAARYADGFYDIDTGECISNLSPEHALFEVYFPVGALDATRGVIKGPDAIVDTRSLPPGVPVQYIYELPLAGREGPFQVEAALMFRAFPPFLIEAFAAYEADQARAGKRAGGPLITRAALSRLEVVEVLAVEVTVP